jgi:hypothetical protein
MKVGDKVLDPLNRRVTIIELDAEWVRVQFGPSYTGREAATARYPRGCVTPIQQEGY